MWLGLSAAAAGMTVFLIILSAGGAALTPRQARTRRIEDVVGVQKEETLYVELEASFGSRLISPLTDRVAAMARSLLPQEKEIQYRRRLELAGNPNWLSVQKFLGIKIILAITMGLIGIAYSPLLAVCSLIVGFIAPDIWLNRRQRERKQEVVRSLPDMLDLLSISVSAGLGFDAALARVAEKFDGPLSTEFSRALQEIRMGKPRREALREMSDRLEVDEVSTLVGAIIQADTLGVSITRVLEIQSAQQRMSRRQKAEETAQKAPIKLLLPLVIFIFPTIFVILLGPAVIQILDVLM
ncbi:MAG: type II secretion system F family protein [Methylocystaceae bacterium]